ncbi:MAG: Mur ligase domain-containing protein, partial [Acidiferrobacterales bacterium]
MHIHILGVGGSFMAGLAMLGRALGHTITGSDAQVYPPASTQLAAAGIDIFSGYSAANLKHKPDVVVIGNALSRGNPEVEAVLDQGLPYTSGAQWVAENILHERWVIAVAGTHGKTTTASMIAWILEYAGLDPGFLIGGVPCNVDVSARLRAAPFFVFEADEYDTACFDKRSKFIHYRP